MPLPRILEPELMDTPEDARDYDAMDHAGVNQRFATDFLAKYPGMGPVLDVGTGTAQIPIEMCRQRPGLKVVALDAASHMIALARRNVERAGLGGMIDLTLANARVLPWTDGHFPAVASNSILHHLADPEAALAEMVRVLAPGGCLFLRDLLRPEDNGTVDHLVRTYAGDANAHQQALFRASLHASLTLEEVRGLAVKLGLPPEGASQTSDRHWTWVAFRP